MRISELQELMGEKYKILRRIGAGGFGEVYLGEHAALGRKVAIKILLESFASQEELVKRFQREARAAATLQHPNIIDIYDVGESEGIYFFVMKYIEGMTLAQKMEQEKRIPQSEIIYIMKQVADALDYAHEHDVVHRDIKPANIMLDQFGKPVLMDFGVARITYEGNLTKTGTLMGTPHYLAPEQPLGKNVDRRSDIYSLGILMYEMLAGKPPFHDENSITLIFKHINEQAPPLKDLVPDADAHLCAVIHKMIAKAPEDRHQTAAEVVEELEALSDIYPMKTTLAGRRSTPATSHNTERLLILAQEHVQQEKISKAIEIFRTIKDRSPDNEVAKKETTALYAKLKERFASHIAALDLTPARLLLAQMEQLVESSELDPLRAELHKAETSMAGTRSMPVPELTRDRPTDPAFPESSAEDVSTLHKGLEEEHTMASRAEEAVSTQIDGLIEQLKFDDASRLISSVRERFPDMAERKTSGLQEAKELYQKLAKAKKLMAAENLEEAEVAFDDFLQAPPMFDYQVLYKLRKEAENLHGQNRKMLFNHLLDKADMFILRKEFESAREPLQKILDRDKNYAPAVRKWKELDDRQFGSSSDAIPAVQAPPVAPAAAAVSAAPKPSAQPVAQSLAAAPAASGSGSRTPLIVVLIVIVLAAIGFFGWQKTHPPEVETIPVPAPPTPTVKPVVPPPTLPPPPTSGKVTVTTEPQGATVLLDGQALSSVTPVDATNLPFGPHTLKIQLKGYKDTEQSFSLDVDHAAVEVPVVMDPAGPVVGSIKVESTPPGAEIYIGKKMLGVTPKVVTNLGPGTYKIVVKKEGFSEFSVPVQVKEGGTASLKATLAEIVKPPEPVAPEPEVVPGMLVEPGPDVVPPQPTKKVSPRYTDAIKDKKLSGTVKVSVLVSETGKVIDAKVVEPVHPLLDDLALKAAREWAYTPATKKGIPVKMWVPLSFTFVQK